MLYFVLTYLLTIEHMSQSSRLVFITCSDHASISEAF